MNGADAYGRSLDDPEGSWLDAARDVDWVASSARVHDGGRPGFERWFPDGRLNSCCNTPDWHVVAGFRSSTTRGRSCGQLRRARSAAGCPFHRARSRRCGRTRSAPIPRRAVARNRHARISSPNTPTPGYLVEHPSSTEPTTLLQGGRLLSMAFSISCGARLHRPPSMRGVL